jgi:hypothetical protein
VKPPSKDEADALALVPDSLTSEERRMLACYRATTPAWRADVVDFANLVANMFPLVVALPLARVRLATNNGKRERGLT